MTWVSENAEWLFSGAAVAVPLAVVGWVLARRSTSMRQSQRSGSHSINVQSGRDMTIKAEGDEA